MIIYNTTYHVSDALCSDLIGYLREHFIPAALSENMLTHPRLSKVLKYNEEEGQSVCLQFCAENMDVVKMWHTSIGAKLHTKLVEKYGQNVAGFTTFLEELHLTHNA